MAGSATVHGPGDGERIGGAMSVTIKATSEDTSGSFYLGEAELPAGAQGPPPHTHERLHDMFYMLEGTLTLQLGEETRDLSPGSFVCIPPGVVHTFANRSDEPVRFLNFSTPGGWEDYMRDLSQLLGRETPPSPKEIGEIASRYDFKVAG